MKNCKATWHKLPAGTGQAIANAITECLNDWQSELSDYMVGINFDIMSSNTRSALDVYALLQQKLGRSLFHLPCRHHILELVGRGSIHYELRPVFWSWHSQIQAFPIKLEFRWPKQVWAIDVWWCGLLSLPLFKFSAARNRLCYSASRTWNLPNLMMTTTNFLSWLSLFLVLVLREDSD